MDNNEYKLLEIDFDWWYSENPYSIEEKKRTFPDCKWYNGDIIVSEDRKKTFKAKVIPYGERIKGVLYEDDNDEPTDIISGLYREGEYILCFKISSARYSPVEFKAFKHSKSKQDEYFGLASHMLGVFCLFTQTGYSKLSVKETASNKETIDYIEEKIKEYENSEISKIGYKRSAYEYPYGRTDADPIYLMDNILPQMKDEFFNVPLPEVFDTQTCNNDESNKETTDNELNV